MIPWSKGEVGLRCEGTYILNKKDRLYIGAYDTLIRTELNLRGIVLASLQRGRDVRCLLAPSNSISLAINLLGVFHPFGNFPSPPGWGWSP